MLVLAMFLGTLSFAGSTGDPTPPANSSFSSICARALEAGAIIQDLYAELARTCKLKDKEIQYLRGRFTLHHLEDDGVVSFYRNLVGRSIGWLQVRHLVEGLPAVKDLRGASGFGSLPPEWKTLKPLVSSKEWDPDFLGKVDEAFLFLLGSLPQFFPQNVRQLQALAFVYYAEKSTWALERRPPGFASAAKAVLIEAGFTLEVTTQFWQAVSQGLKMEWSYKPCCGKYCFDFCPTNLACRTINSQCRQNGDPTFPFTKGEPPSTLLLFKHFPKPEVTQKLEPAWLDFLNQL